MDNLKTSGTVSTLKYWCYKVLPLVYDDSLSYYELLCKVVSKLNELIEKYASFDDMVEEIQSAIDALQKQIDEFDTSYIEKLIKDKLSNMIYVCISDAGYIIYYVPESWDDISFNTTGLDIQNEQLADNGHVANYEYGRLVLSMYADS